MNKRIVSLALFMILNLGISAWGQSDEVQIRSQIGQLFHAMRLGDSSMAKAVFDETSQLNSVSIDLNGKTTMQKSSVNRFLSAIGTPHEEIWDERILSYEIKIDKPLGMAWTEYNFYRGKQILHCGVNVFEFVHKNDKWLISNITDTRRTSPCKTDPQALIDSLMDNWHHAAAVADEDVFFGSMTEDGIYIGTDISERWSRKEMEVWALPYFQRETAWAFTPLNRIISFNEDLSIGWFDEELETWMGSCRGSGVVVKTKNGWKISHYHLAVAVPNDHIEGYLELIGKQKIKRE